MSNNHNSLLERGPAEIAPSLAPVLRRTAPNAPPQIAEESRKKQEKSKKIVQEYIASLGSATRAPEQSVPKMQKSEADRQEQSKKLVQKYMASLGPASEPPIAAAGKRSTLSVDEKKDRKRKINRLSAHRKRVRERVHFDTLTDRYAQINYRSEALKADNERLVKLVSSLKGTVNEAEMARDTGMSKETRT